MVKIYAEYGVPAEKKLSKYWGYFTSQLITSDLKVYYLLPGKENLLGLPASLLYEGNSGRAKLALKKDGTICRVITSKSEDLKREAKFYQQIYGDTQLLFERNIFKYYLIIPYYPGSTLRETLNCLLEKIKSQQVDSNEDYTSLLISLILYVFEETIKIHDKDTIHGDLHLGNIICDFKNQQWVCHIIDPKMTANNFTTNDDMKKLWDCIYRHIKDYIDANKISCRKINELISVMEQCKSVNELIYEVLHLQLENKSSNIMSVLFSRSPSYKLSEKQLEFIQSNTKPKRRYQVIHYANYYRGYIIPLIYAVPIFLLINCLPAIGDQTVTAILCSIILGAIIGNLYRIKETAVEQEKVVPNKLGLHFFRQQQEDDNNLSDDDNNLSDDDNNLSDYSENDLCLNT